MVPSSQKERYVPPKINIPVFAMIDDRLSTKRSAYPMGQVISVNPNWRYKANLTMAPTLSFILTHILIDRDQFRQIVRWMIRARFAFNKLNQVYIPIPVNVGVIARAINPQKTSQPATRSMMLSQQKTIAEHNKQSID